MIRRALKVLGWVILSALFVVLITAWLIQLPSIQNVLKDRVLIALRQRIKSSLTIDSIHVYFPNRIMLRGVYVEDQKKDTLLAGTLVQVDINLLRLLNQEVELKEVKLQGITANIDRDRKGIFNFDFILNSFATDPQKKDSSVAPSKSWKIALSALALRGIRVRYIDAGSGMTIRLTLHELNSRFRAFDPEKSKYLLQSSSVNGLDASIVQISPLAQVLTPSPGHKLTPNAPAVPLEMQGGSPPAITRGIDFGGKAVADVRDRAFSAELRTKPPSPAASLVLDPGQLDLSRIQFLYRSETLSASILLGHFTGQSTALDLVKQTATLSHLSLGDSQVIIRLIAAKSPPYVGRTPDRSAGTNPRAPKSVNPPATANKPSGAATIWTSHASGLATASTVGTPAGWTIHSGTISIKNSGFQFIHSAGKPSLKGLDYNHIGLSALHLEMDHLNYSPEYIEGLLTRLSLHEKSGLRIDQAHATFSYSSTGIELKDFLIKTPQSTLKRSLRVHYPSLASISKDPGRLQIAADWSESQLAIQDLLYIMPSLEAQPTVRKLSASPIRFSGRIRGSIQDLILSQLSVEVQGGTRLRLDGRIKGLPRLEKMEVNIPQFQLVSTRKDILSLAATDQIPAGVNLPKTVSLEGNLSGGIQNFKTSLRYRSSRGNAELSGTYHLAGKNRPTYTVFIKTQGLDVGAMYTPANQMGKINLTATLQGEGFVPKTAKIALKAVIGRVVIRQRTIRHFELQGHSSAGVLAFTSQMRDPNLRFTLSGTANLTKKYPAFDARLALDTVDLHYFNLSPTPATVSGTLAIHAATAQVNFLNARLEAEHLLFIQTGKRYTLDSLSVLSMAGKDSSSVTVRTPFLMARLSGVFQLTEMQATLTSLLQRYIPLPPSSSGTVQQSPSTPQRYAFFIRVLPSPTLSKMIPHLKRMKAITFQGRVDSRSETMVVSGSIPDLEIGSTVVQEFRLDVHTTGDKLRYLVKADNVKISSSLHLLFPSLAGEAGRDEATFSIKLLNKFQRERYRLAGVVKAEASGFHVQLSSNGLVLDYQPWAVNPGNDLLITPRGLSSSNVRITYGEQSIALQSRLVTGNGSLELALHHFQLQTLTKALDQDIIQLGGEVDGLASMDMAPLPPSFRSQLRVREFTFRGDTVGNLELGVAAKDAATVAAKLVLTGHGNRVILDGTYGTTSPSLFNGKLHLIKLNTHSLEGFSFGNFTQGTGYLSGELALGGTLNAPIIEGDIHFNKVGFVVSSLHSFFLLPAESLTFTPEGIRLNSINLLDSAGNHGQVTGQIKTKNYTDFDFGVDLKTDNLRLIHSKKGDNKLFYGTLYVSSQVKIRGDINTPVVDATLNVNDKTEMTLVIPSSDPGLTERVGVVEFIDPSAPKVDSSTETKRLDSIQKTDVNGLDLTATVRINKASHFTILLDPSTGDEVRLSGDAQLNASLDPSGKTSLTGTYTVNQGSYNLSYASVKRKFTFKKGSTITWTGDPLSATLSLTAIYLAKVPPIDLVSSQLSSTDNQIQYKQKLPFQVVLNLKKEILKPEISFDILLPDSTYTVSQEVINTVNARLSQVRQDPNELNKQVLGVLILGHFIGDNPLQSQGGSSGVAGLVRNSVSGLLSDQLNRLAGNLISGVDLNFDLQSGTDYSSGAAQNRTDLSVGLSKRFLNDRLTVSVGNNFNLEGQNQPGQKATTLAGNVSVNYKLSQDGRYVLRAYRRDQFVVLEGQIVETGVGFSLTIDYNRFQQLFGRKKRPSGRFPTHE